MSLSDDILSDTRAVFRAQWSRRPGRVIPEADDLTLTGNDGVDLEAVILYADMAKSSEMVKKLQDTYAAELYKVFLSACGKIVRSCDGSICAYDGDRIMAVFIGETRRTNAVKCAMKIKYAVDEILTPENIDYKKENAWTIDFGIGIDCSQVLVARTGVRGSNDLVWVGESANYAAKLSTLREDTYKTWITQSVYENMADSVKMSGSNTMWEQRVWNGRTVYRSNYRWKLDS